VMRAAYDRREVWLRGNMRPGVGLMAAAGLLAAVTLVPLATAGAAAWLMAAVACVVAIVMAGGLAVCLVAAGPRLARRGDRLEIRLAPGRIERVPLELVECIFRGTEPLEATAEGEAATPRGRVGTLVVRFAERSQQWHDRETFRPWGSWTDGHAVIDGRWCEPLTRATVERIAADLVAAKREVAGGR
jgi:hypothetical protein